MIKLKDCIIGGGRHKGSCSPFGDGRRQARRWHRRRRRHFRGGGCAPGMYRSNSKRDRESWVDHEVWGAKRGDRRLSATSFETRRPFMWFHNFLQASCRVDPIAAFRPVNIMCSKTRGVRHVLRFPPGENSPQPQSCRPEQKSRSTAQTFFGAQKTTVAQRNEKRETLPLFPVRAADLKVAKAFSHCPPMPQPVIAAVKQKAFGVSSREDISFRSA